MVKHKRKAEEEKVKEKENQKVNPSPSELGLPATIGILEVTTTSSPPAGEPAPTVPTGEDGEKVQVGQVDPEQLQEQQKEQEERQQQLAKAVHPVIGTVFQSNVVKYKGRKTEFLTIPKKLTEHEDYPFKGTNKTTGVKITLTQDGSRLIVERL